MSTCLHVFLGNLLSKISVRISCDPALTTNEYRWYCVSENPLRVFEDLVLPWEPLLPHIVASNVELDIPCVSRLTLTTNTASICLFAREYFDPGERYNILSSIIAYFDAKRPEDPGVSIMIAQLVPTGSAMETAYESHPSQILPHCFHILAYQAKSYAAGLSFIDFFSRLAKGHLKCPYIEFGAQGIFKRAESDEIFSTIWRLSNVENFGYRKLECVQLAEYVAEWLVYSISPFCLEKESSILSDLESFIALIGDFSRCNDAASSSSNFTPEVVLFLVERFNFRWHQENNGDLDIPQARKINKELKRKFVLMMKNTILAGCFSSSKTIQWNCLSALKNLAYLEPNLILSTALQQVYITFGLNNTDDNSMYFSFCILQVLASVMIQQKGFRCHLPILLIYSLENINESNLALTKICLKFIRTAACCMPWTFLTQTQYNESESTILVEDWFAKERENLRNGDPNLEVNYSTLLSDEFENQILRSSVVFFESFNSAFFDKAFDLLNIFFGGPSPPDKRITLDFDILIEATCVEFIKSLSPKFLGKAIEKLGSLLTVNTIVWAKNHVAHIYCAACSTDAQRALPSFLPILIENIHSCIIKDTSGPYSNLLSEPRAMSWYHEILRVCLEGSGDALLSYKEEILGLVQFMEERYSESRASTLVESLMMSLLRGLTNTYVIGPSYSVMELGTDNNFDKIHITSMNKINWHRPTLDEIHFASEIFETRISGVFEVLEGLISDHDTATDKQKWRLSTSDALSYIGSLISGAATLFDPHIHVGDTLAEEDRSNHDTARVIARSRIFRRVLSRNDPYFIQTHSLRDKALVLVSKLHDLISLVDEIGENIYCFESLYGVYEELVLAIGYDGSTTYERDICREWAAEFEIPGLPHKYPRSLYTQHVEINYKDGQRLSTDYRYIDKLEEKLLLDLVHGCTSSYDAVRWKAVHVLTDFLETTMNSAGIVVPRIIDKLQELCVCKDEKRIMGGLKTLTNDCVILAWKRDSYSSVPQVLELLINLSRFDADEMVDLIKENLRLLRASSSPFDKISLVDQNLASAINRDGDLPDTIISQNTNIAESRAEVESQIAAAGTTMLTNASDFPFYLPFLKDLFNDFTKHVPIEYISFVVKTMNDSRPKLRSQCKRNFLKMMTTEIAKYECDSDPKVWFYGKTRAQAVTTNIQDRTWAKESLDKSGTFEIKEEPLDFHRMWFIRHKNLENTNSQPQLISDNCLKNSKTLTTIGSHLDKKWVELYFKYMQEDKLKPEDDEMVCPILCYDDIKPLVLIFMLMGHQATLINLHDIQELLTESLKQNFNHERQLGIAGMILALFQSCPSVPSEFRERILSFTIPLLIDILKNLITRDNKTIWIGVVQCIFTKVDPQSIFRLIQEISSFRIDSSNNFTNISRLLVIHEMAIEIDGSFWDIETIVDHLFDNMNKQDKEIGFEIGWVLSSIFSSGHRSYSPAVHLPVESYQTQSALWMRPYTPSPELESTLKRLFLRLEGARLHNPETYIDTSQAALGWLAQKKCSSAYEDLIFFLPKPVLSEMFHMMDLVVNDEETTKEIERTVLFLGGLKFNRLEHEEFVCAFIQKFGIQNPLSHRKLSIRTIERLYLSKLISTDSKQKEFILNSVFKLLQEDGHSGIYREANSSLCKMLQRTPLTVVEPIIMLWVKDLRNRLISNMERKNKKEVSDIMQNERYRLVKGLGSLVESSPYSSNLPEWMVQAVVLLGKIAQDSSTLAGKYAAISITDFKRARLRYWDIIIKVTPLYSLI